MGYGGPVFNTSKGVTFTISCQDTTSKTDHNYFLKKFLSIMEYLQLCLKVIEEEKKKFNLDKNYFILCISKISGDVEFFESPYFRCAFMYKYASVYLSFIQDSVKTFILQCSKVEDLFKEWKSNSNLKLCSLTCGPALDYFGLILAITNNVKIDLQPFFKNVHVISKSAQWRNTYNIMTEAIELGYIKGFPVSMLCDDFKITQDPFKSFSMKQRNVVEDADILFMMKLLRITNPADESVKEKKTYFKELVDAMKIGSFLFCIDTKPSIDVISDILYKIPGEFIYQPVCNIFKFSESFPEAFKEHYGSLPAFNCRGWFFIWKKISYSSLNFPPLMANPNIKLISDALHINKSSDIDSRNPNTIVSDSGIVGTNVPFISVGQPNTLYSNFSSVENAFFKYSLLNTAVQSKVLPGLFSSFHSDDKTQNVTEIIDLHKQYLEIQSKNKLTKEPFNCHDSIITSDEIVHLERENEVKLLLEDICSAVSTHISLQKFGFTTYDLQNGRSSKNELLSSINIDSNAIINSNSNEHEIKQLNGSSISSNSSDASKETQDTKSTRRRGKKNKLTESCLFDSNASINSADNSYSYMKKGGLISDSSFKECNLITNKMKILSLESPGNNKINADQSKVENNVAKSSSSVGNSKSENKIKVQQQKLQNTLEKFDLILKNPNVEDEIEATSVKALTDKIKTLVKSFENVLARHETSTGLPVTSNAVNDMQDIPFQFGSAIFPQVVENPKEFNAENRRSYDGASACCQVQCHANHRGHGFNHVCQSDKSCSRSHFNCNSCVCQCSHNLNCVNQCLEKRTCCSLGACSAQYVCNHCMYNSLYQKSVSQNDTNPCLVIPLANINKETLAQIFTILQNSKDN